MDETHPADRPPPPAAPNDTPPRITHDTGAIPTQLAEGECREYPEVPGYEFLGLLGHGGMGVVYRARQLKANRLVALKMIRAADHASPTERLRFEIETEAVARLQHPHIVQLYEVGEVRGQPFFSLEFCDGGTLGDQLKKQRPSPGGAAALIETLARAMHYAHLRGVVHRDLKPGNVLLAGAERVPKITDFGLAKRIDAAARDVSQSGAIMGTAAYMAPEQAAGKVRDTGPAADVYALGAILYELLTGRPPFQAATAMDTVLQVLSDEPVPVRRLQPKTPRDLETICLKCLEKDARKRYTGAEELADDLKRWQAGEPIRARPVGRLESGWKWARRRPAVAGLLTAVALSVLGGLALVSWQWRRAENEWMRAEQTAQAESKAREEAEAARQRAEAARQRAEDRQAHLALARGLGLCEQGELDQGLLWLVRALELANRAGATDLDRPLRVNLAAWGRLVPHLKLDLRHPKACTQVVFSPDGRLLASGGEDGAVHFWDVASGKGDGRSLALYFPPLHHKCYAVAFSPDGKTLATGGADGKAVLWDVASRRRLRDLAHIPDNGDANVFGVAFSPDGKLIATAGNGGVARLWHVATGQPAGAPLRHGGPESNTTQVAFSPDGRTVYASGNDGVVRRWDVATRKRIEPPLPARSTAWALRCSPNGESVLIGTTDGTLHLWDTETASFRLLPSQGSSVKAVAFSPDGRLFAAAAGGVVSLSDALSGLPIGPLLRQDSEVASVAFSSDGRSLAVGEAGGAVRVWTAPHVPFLPSVPIDGTGYLNTTAFDRAGRSLMVCGSIAWVLFDASKDAVVRRSTSGSIDWREFGVIRCAALSPDGRTVVTGTRESKAVVWDAVTGKLLHRTGEHLNALDAVAFLPDSATLLTYSTPSLNPLDFWKERAALWNVETGRIHRSLLRELAPDVNRLALHPDGRTLLLGCSDGTARSWDVQTNRPVGEPVRHAGAVTTVAFGPDAAHFLTGCRDGTVRQWDTATGRPIGELLRHPREVSAAVFSPDGKTILAGDLEGTARFWDGASGQPLGVPLRHAGAIIALAFHPDGRRVVTAGMDHRVRQWEVPPPPLPGSPERIRRWVEGLTGLEMDDAGVIHRLAPEVLAQRLREDGGRHREEEAQ